MLVGLPSLGMRNGMAGQMPRERAFVRASLGVTGPVAHGSARRDVRPGIEQHPKVQTVIGLTADQMEAKRATMPAGLVMARGRVPNADIPSLPSQHRFAPEFIKCLKESAVIAALSAASCVGRRRQTSAAAVARRSSDIPVSMVARSEADPAWIIATLIKTPPACCPTKIRPDEPFPTSLHLPG